jgi:hypothetical protein
MFSEALYRLLLKNRCSAEASSSKKEGWHQEKYDMWGGTQMALQFVPKGVTEVWSLKSEPHQTEARGLYEKAESQWVDLPIPPGHFPGRTGLCWHDLTSTQSHSFPFSTNLSSHLDFVNI